MAADRRTKIVQEAERWARAMEQNITPAQRTRADFRLLYTVKRKGNK